jgi:hypothetical protein
MCEECVARVAHLVGSVLEEEDIPLELAFPALHAVARVTELQMGATTEETAAQVYIGREVGGAIAESMELRLPCLDPTEGGPPELKHLQSLVVAAAMKHQQEKPD